MTLDKENQNRVITNVSMNACVVIDGINSQISLRLSLISVYILGVLNRLMSDAFFYAVTF
jgi:hypothetical protein